MKIRNRSIVYLFACMETHDFFKKRMAQALLVFILAVANSMSTQATTVRPLDLPELIQRAEVIADVTVTTTACFLVSPAGGKAIQTRVTFTLNSAPLKGQVTSPFTLNFLGGTVGTHRMEISGMPKFQVGDRLILFSYGPDKTFVSPVIGFDQGALRVIRDQQNNVDRVYRWWGQPVNGSQPFTSRAPASSESATAEQLRTANSVEEFMRKISPMIHQ
jgi:hypothetical protein